MACKECVKADTYQNAHALLFIGKVTGIVGGFIGMIATWVQSADEYGYEYVEHSMNWVQFAICFAAMLPGLVAIVNHYWEFTPRHKHS